MVEEADDDVIREKLRPIKLLILDDDEIDNMTLHDKLGNVLKGFRKWR